MRYTVNSSMVAHLWAHQSQYKAKNKTGYFYFEGKDIYSYGSHFKCASVVKNQKGETGYLLTTRTYSRSTNEHMFQVKAAIPSNAFSFSTERRVSLTSSKMDELNYRIALFYIADQIKAINTCIVKQQKARLSNYSRAVEKCLIDIEKWIKFWGLSKSQKSLKGNKLPSAKQALLSRGNDKIRIYWTVKEESKAAYKEIEDLQKLFRLIIESGLMASCSDNDFQGKVKKLFADRSGDNNIWEAFENRKKRHLANINLSSKERRITRNLPFDQKQVLWKEGSKSIKQIFVPCDCYNTILRIHKGKIETSKGIVIEQKEAVRVWQFVDRLHKNEVEFTRNTVRDIRNNKWKIDSYKDGIMTAGCHKIPYSEMREIAVKLNLAS